MHKLISDLEPPRVCFERRRRNVEVITLTIVIASFIAILWFLVDLIVVNALGTILLLYFYIKQTVEILEHHRGYTAVEKVLRSNPSAHAILQKYEVRKNFFDRYIRFPKCYSLKETSVFVLVSCYANCPYRSCSKIINKNDVQATEI